MESTARDDVSTNPSVVLSDSDIINANNVATSLTGLVTIVEGRLQLALVFNSQSPPHEAISTQWHHENIINTTWEQGT